MKSRLVNNYYQILSDFFLKSKKSLDNKNIGVLISGGIDSSIIADYVVHFFPKAVLISLQSEKSTDDDFVKILSKHLKKIPLLVRVTREDLIEIKDEIKKLLIASGVEVNPMQIALASVYYWLFKEAKKQKISTVFTGQGPDILLGGYNKYRQLSGDNLKLAIFNDLPLLKIDQARDMTMAKVWGIKIINPYLEKTVIDFCLTVPAKFIIKNNQEKYLSRALGKKLNLPKEIVERPKQAMQYSTGVSKLIK
jgi:asparagine synthetase B (glutamine-hydrolysing)